jgi:CRP-like cAMP-binding protein
MAEITHEEKVDTGHTFLREGQEVTHLYLVVNGSVNVHIELPTREREIIISAVGPGRVFAWSALVPPHKATASVRATAPCHVLAIDCQQLREAFEEDPRFGHIMMTKAAQITRDRIANMNIEMLAYLAEEAGGE